MEEIKEFFKKCKWDSIIIAVMTVLVGILCVALPNESANVLCIVFGSALIVSGISLMVRYFAFDHLLGGQLLVMGVVFAIAGVFCIVYTDAIQSILTVIFGLIIVLDSLNSLSDSILCAKAKAGGWLWLLILSILTAILGVCVMFSGFDTVMIFAGCSLIIEGVKRMVVTFAFSKKIRDAKKYLKENEII